MMLMNQEITSPVKGCTVNSECEYSRGKEMQYGLMILIELAENYYSEGSDLASISKKFNFNLYAIVPITYKLEEAGLISCRIDDPGWLFLKKEPLGGWILEVVSTLKYIFYSEKL